MPEAGQIQAYFKISKDLSQGNKRRRISGSQVTEPRPNKTHLDLSGESLMLQRKVYTRAKSVFSVVLLTRS